MEPEKPDKNPKNENIQNSAPAETHETEQGVTKERPTTDEKLQLDLSTGGGNAPDIHPAESALKKSEKKITYKVFAILKSQPLKLGYNDGNKAHWFEFDSSKRLWKKSAPINTEDKQSGNLAYCSALDKEFLNEFLLQAFRHYTAKDATENTGEIVRKHFCDATPVYDVLFKKTHIYESDIPQKDLDALKTLLDEQKATIAPADIEKLLNDAHLNEEAKKAHKKRREKERDKDHDESHHAAQEFFRREDDKYDDPHRYVEAQKKHEEHQEKQEKISISHSTVSCCAIISTLGLWLGLKSGNKENDAPESTGSKVLRYSLLSAAAAAAVYGAVHMWKNRGLYRT